MKLIAIVCALVLSVGAENRKTCHIRCTREAVECQRRANAEGHKTDACTAAFEACERRCGGLALD